MPKTSPKKESSAVTVTAECFELLLQPVAGMLAGRELPVKIGYRISRIMERLRQESKAYFEERRKLVKRHAKKDDSGKPLPVPGSRDGEVQIEDREKFTDELKKLQAERVDLGLEKMTVRLEDLPALSVAEFDLISLFLDIEE